MSENSVAAVRERWAKATPGPWEAVISETGISSMPSRGEVIAEDANKLVVWHGKWTTPEDATAIAAAPDDIAYLLGRVEELERENKRLRGGAQAAFELAGVGGHSSHKRRDEHIARAREMAEKWADTLTAEDCDLLAALPSGAVGEEPKP